MPGPLPSPDHERLRRNLDARFTAPTGGVPPPEGRAGWRQEARDWFDAALQGVAAASYAASDWQAVLRGADLVDDLYEDRPLDKGLLAELRQIETGLLMSARARRAARLDLPAVDIPPPIPASAAPTIAAGVIDFEAYYLGQMQGERAAPDRESGGAVDAAGLTARYAGQAPVTMAALLAEAGLGAPPVGAAAAGWYGVHGRRLGAQLLAAGWSSKRARRAGERVVLWSAPPKAGEA